MPRKPQGDTALTNAERARRARAKRSEIVTALRHALHRIKEEADTLHEAVEIAEEALEGETR